MTQLVNGTLSHVNYFYDEVGKHIVLTNVKSDRGFESWLGYEVKPPDYHSSLDENGQLDYQSPVTYLGDEKHVVNPVVHT